MVETLVEKEIRIDSHTIDYITLDDVQYMDRAILENGFERGEPFHLTSSLPPQTRLNHYVFRYSMQDATAKFVARSICEDPAICSEEYSLTLKFTCSTSTLHAIADRIAEAERLDPLARLLRE